MVKKLLLSPLLIVFACLLAATLGFVQNLLTYQISPPWYHEWKFFQFQIPETYHNTLGAGFVGILATWWMGLILSPFLLIPAAFHKTSAGIVRIFVTAALLVLAGTVAAECVAAIWGQISITGSSYPYWAERFSQPVSAARVELINAVGYLAAGVSGLLACGYAVFAVRRASKL